MAIDQKNWDKAAIDLGGSILQSWAWGQFQQAAGSKPHYLLGPDWQALVIEQALPFGKKYWYAPRGPLGNADAALAAIIGQAQPDHQIIFVRVEPQAVPQGVLPTKDIQPKDNWTVDLQPETEKILAGMKPKHRYNISLAARHGVTVRQGGRQDLIDVWKLLLETARRNNFRLHPQSYYWEMWDHLAPDYLRLFVAEFQGQMLAASLVTVFGQTATYLHGGSSQQKKELMAPYLLHWEAIKQARAIGCAGYDLGGISEDPNHAWAGITRFKKGFGGHRVSFPGTYDRPLSPLWYNVYRNLRQFRSLLR